MRNKLLYLLPLLLLCNSVEAKQHIPDISNTRSVKGTFVFKDDSASIAQHYQSPTWFRNAKFGIFIHWGVYSVPAYGNEWYPRNMYDSNSDVHRHHVETYGPVDQFGYKDFIPMFKAERFNPEQWAKLFKEAGARYVVPVAEHHDGFAMYQSTFNHWNAAEMGPKRDILGELKAAILHEGMHFGLSSHRAENAWFYNMGMKIPSDVRDTTITLYGERIGRPGKDGEMNPDPGQYPGSNERSKREWLMHTYELIDNYQPELIWFDWTVGMYPFRKTFYKFLAHYYNSALDSGKNRWW
jgi:alpha-L-fucosidase